MCVEARDQYKESQLLSTLLLRQSLTDMGLTGWLASKLQGSSCLHVSSTGIVGAHCHIWVLFVW